jgi:HTH-type transcriptional regulator/antitoxin HigA
MCGRDYNGPCPALTSALARHTLKGGFHMRIKSIKTASDYQEAFARSKVLMDAEPGTPEREELELLAALMEAYEDEH